MQRCTKMYKHVQIYTTTNKDIQTHATYTKLCNGVQHPTNDTQKTNNNNRHIQTDAIIDKVMHRYTNMCNTRQPAIMCKSTYNTIQ